MPPAESLAFWREGLSDAERASAMVRAQKLIADLPQETYRRDRDIDHVRLYEADPVVTMYSFSGRYYAESGNSPLAPPDDSTNNKAKAAIDTLMSQVASTDQRARFLSSDADYRQKRRAREMQHFADGLAHELKLHELKQRVALDAAILQSGVGAIQFYRDRTKDGHERCAAQRILATELAIDPTDGMVDGAPCTLYRRRPVPRDKVIACFAKDDEKLADLIKSQQVKNVMTAGVPADDVEVFEAWHLASEEGADDGRHIIALDVEGGVLLVEPYKKTFHEIVFFSWEGRFTTAWGLSLMGQVRKLQRRINANSYRIDKAQRLFSSGHIYVPREMSLDRGSLSNEIGSTWTGNGPTPPQQILYQAATKEMYDQVERDGQRVFENLGINQGASEGSSDVGLGASGAARREETKKSDKRNSVRQQRWERYHPSCIRVALSIVRDIVTGAEAADKDAKGEKKPKRTSGYRVAAPGKRGLTVVDWKDVAMDEKDYVLDVKVASPVPTDPAGLMAFGKEMVDMGAWTPQQLAGYMQDLDQDGRVNRELAPERRLEQLFEQLLYDKAAAAVPNEFTNLELALSLGVDYLAQGEEDGVPEKHLERVRRYLKRCKALDKAAKAEAQAAAMPPAPPGGAPAMPAAA